MKPAGYQALDERTDRPSGCEDCRAACRSCCASAAVIFAIVCLGSLLIWPWLVHSCHVALEQTPEVIDGYTPRRISFSSCMGNWREHGLMDRIRSDVHIFLGDNIYGDDYNYEFEAVKPNWASFLRLPTHLVQYYALQYRKLSCRQSFRELARRTPYVLSIWDDHDYGTDDEIHTNPMKEASKRMFAQFWRLNAARQSTIGVYGSYEFKGEGASVLVVLPDLHYSVTQDTLFDHEQWEWMTALLARHTRSLIIMGLSTPINTLHASYPDEVSALLAMLNRSNTVIISGDPHTPSIIHHLGGHIEIISSPLAMVGGASDPEFAHCADNCTVRRNRDNYGMIDLRNRTGGILSEHGFVLQTRLFT